MTQIRLPRMTKVALRETVDYTITIKINRYLVGACTILYIDHLSLLSYQSYLTQIN